MKDKRIIAHDMDGVPLTREDLGIVNKLLDKMDLNKHQIPPEHEGEAIAINNLFLKHPKVRQQMNTEEEYYKLRVGQLYDQLKQRDSEIQHLKKENKTLAEAYQSIGQQWDKAENEVKELKAKVATLEASQPPARQQH